MSGDSNVDTGVTDSGANGMDSSGGHDGGPIVCVFGNSASTFGGCVFGP
jgi:hypothetical protein